MLLGGIGHEGEVIFGGELQIGLLLRRFGIHNIRIFDFCIGILLQIQCKEIGRGKDGFLRQCRIIPLAEHQRGNFKQGAATGGIHFLPHIFISVQEKAKKNLTEKLTKINEKRRFFFKQRKKFIWEGHFFRFVLVKQQNL